MISKKEFCNILAEIKTEINMVDEVDTILRQYNRDSSIYTTPILDTLIHTLELVFQDEEAWIDYWIWEEDFGESYKDGDVTDKDGNIIPLKTAFDLYDLLMKNKGERTKIESDN